MQGRKRSAVVRAVSWLCLAALLCVAGALPVRAGTGFPFRRPDAIKPNVEFWVKVFAQYSDRDFIVHDRDNISRIYGLITLPGSGPPSQDDIDWVNDYLKTKYSAILMRLEAGAKPGDYEAAAVARLFAGQAHPDYAAAARDLRVQEGMREEFRASLVRAHHYMPVIVRILESFGLPPGLALLPTVESGFRIHARSKAGAVGLWQFTRATGRQYMMVGRWRDERLNPIRSTEAAAKLLAHNHELLGDWPLAITAYDYGTGGMMQAVEATDGGGFSQIVRSYDGPRFGFATKNYYAEFLAALHVWQHREQYFPGISEESFREVRVEDSHVRRERYRHHYAIHRVAFRRSRSHYKAHRVRHHVRYYRHHRRHRRVVRHKVSRASHRYRSQVRQVSEREWSPDRDS